MAKIKCEINEDSTAVKFEAVESRGIPCHDDRCQWEEGSRNREVQA